MTHHDAWLTHIRERGWGDLFAAALDALEPLGALGAQLVYTAQPALSLFVPSAALTAVAQALETPDGIARLRAALDDQDDA